MKDFLDLLVHDYKFPPFLASQIMIIFYLITFFILLYKSILYLVKIIRKRYIKKVVDQDLYPYFIHNEIYNYTKLYIPQYYQNITPSEGEEPGKKHAAAAKSKLMKEFISKGLITESPIKYFIILSDTGMGKTAFLINLFIKYKSQRVKLKQKKYDIKLFPLGAIDSLEKIKNITNKKETILLLDAFDEDIKAVHDYKNRMLEILENVKDFRKVIFTCRTQFFPTKDEEPQDTNDITFGENYKHKIHKLYLSAFDDYDILKYLLKKYGINIYKLFRAYRLVKKSPSLMFRPMLLAFIDDLIKEKLYYNFTYEMYTVLIDNWIKRESMKPAINHRADQYSKDLMKFSKFLAKNLYTERENRQGYFITLEQLKKLTINQTFNTDSLTLEDKTGRSLLNRNSIGQFKFAHKSILEYFLALEIFQNPDFLHEFDFHGMDATQNFHFEMIANFLKSSEGKYFLELDTNPKLLSALLPNQIKRINKLIIQNVSNKEFKKLAGLKHLECMILTDPSFAFIYLIYLFICIQKRNKNILTTNEANKNTFITQTLEYQTEIRLINDLRPDLDYDCLRIIINNVTIDDISKQLFQKLTSPFISKSPLSAEEIIQLRELRNHIRNGVSENVVIGNSITQIQNINQVEKYLPNVKIYY